MDKFINENSIKILDSLAEGIYVINKGFKVRFVNKAACEILNKLQKDLMPNFQLILRSEVSTKCHRGRCRISNSRIKEDISNFFIITLFKFVNK